MEGRDFAAPAHLLTERGALVHRATSRIAPSGHSSVQHTGHFPAGKYYPSHIPMAPHSSGLMGNSSASFMGTFLASSLGSPPSHPSHHSRPPSSPSSPSFRGGPHSSASQIWFSHSHEYPRFSGSLAHTFLPMSHLDHHANGGVLYGQHRFYDTQKHHHHHHSHAHQQHPHYPQHPLPLEEVNSRALERHKASLPMEYSKDPQIMGKPLSACLHNGKMQNGETGNVAGPKTSISSCGGEGTPLGTMGGGGNSHGRHMSSSGNSRCTKEGISGEMRISERPSDCLERGQAPLHHSLSYPVPPPLQLGSTGGVHSHPHPHTHPHTHAHPGGFHCLQLHPSHPHHPHPSHHAHHHPEFFCPPPPAALGNTASHDRGQTNAGREPKVTGPTFVPSVADAGEKHGGTFQLGNTDCQIVGSGGGNTKDKNMDKNAGGGHHSSWHRKQQQQQQQQQQQHAYRKTEKAPDWMQSHHHHLQASQLPPPIQQQPQQQPPQPQKQHQVGRSRSVECVNSAVDMEMFRSSLPQGPKTGHPVPHSVNTSPYRDCSHPGPPPNSSPLGNKNMSQHSASGGSCSLQRDGQKVARIRHQQHGRPGPDAPTSGDLNQGMVQEMKRKMDMSAYGYGGNSGQQHHQQPTVPQWSMRPTHHMPHNEEEQRKSYMELGSSTMQHSQQQQQRMNQPPQPTPAPPVSQQQQQPQQQPEPQGSTRGESSAMKSLLKYSNQQQPQLLSQKTPFGGLGSLKSGPAGGSCALQINKQTLPSRKGPVNDNERPDYSGRHRDIGEAGHGEGEVRQPPVGIAVAVARQREPSCRSSDGHSSSRHGRVHPTVKPAHTMYPSDPTTEEERKMMSGEQIGLTCLDRDRDVYIDNKERVEFSRIHPSNSCHGDLTSHLMVPGGTSLQSGQLADPAAHSAHHHWMPRTGSPSLWMTGHSYGIGHTALHQNLPPGFSTAMPGPLQTVLPLPQDPSAQLVVLPTDAPAHPAPHHLVMEQPGLWPPVYGARGPASHMQHPTVYSRSQFLRQQELYALQQHQQLQHQHQSHQSPQTHAQPHPPQPQQQQQQHKGMQKRADESTVDLEELIPKPRTSKPSKPYSYNPAQRNTSPPGACTAHLSPCCQSPSMRPHPKSTPSTPCPVPSPAVTTPQSPTISTATSQMPKGADPQDKRGEGQPLQDYPESLEPLPPGYTYSAVTIGYRNGPSPQDIQLAEPAELEAIQSEPCEHAPQPLSSLGEGMDCQAVIRPLPEPLAPKEVEQGDEGSVNKGVLDQREEVEAAAVTVANYASRENEVETQGAAEEEVLVCPPADSPVCEAASCPLPLGMDEPERSQTVITLEDDDDEPLGEESQVEHAMSEEQKPVLGTIVELNPTPPVALEEQCASTQLNDSKQQEELLMFDLHSLATLATARSLEMSSQADNTTCSGRQFPARRTFNLRRKCSWTPRNEPVCQAKGSVETMDGPELEMRVKLAELQRHYKEKQRELAKLQRKHDHKEETPRSPARRGPGRPRKKKPILATSSVSSEGQRKVLMVAGHSLTPEELGGGGDSQRRKKRLSSRMAQLKQKSQGKKTLSGMRYRDKEVSPCHSKHGHRSQGNRRESGGHSDTASVDSGPQESWPGEVHRGSKKETHDPTHHSKTAARVHRGQRRESLGESSNPESDSSEQGEEEEEGSQDSDEGQDLRAPPPRDVTSSSSVTGPSPSSIVKLEANQKARNKKQRQELYSHSLSGAEGEVKVRKKNPSRLSPASAVKIRQEDHKTEGVTRPCTPRSKEPRWGSHNKRGNRFRRSMGLPTFPTTSERLKRATRKSTVLRGTINKQAKGRAVSRLLESFAADEGFQMDGSSFSEEEEDDNSDSCNKNPEPNCVLAKELLTDGLKILVSKEDELLYAARIHTMDFPDFSVTIDGERGNRAKIYSLEQLLREAVLDVRPESEAMLNDGTRVCAYWSERSRCLYPGYVRRVMVEFDDGDRGKISVPNIRLLPPGYQIHPSLTGCRKRTSHNLFQFNGTPRKALRLREDDSFASTQIQPLVSTQSKGLFSSSSFEVDSFSSIANGYSSFCTKPTGSRPDLSVGPKSGVYGQKRRQDELVLSKGKKSEQEFLVKLDHEGVTSPKTKNSKALLLRGGSSGVSAMPKTEGYSHPVLLVKDNKKGDNSRVELLLKGTTPQRKPSPSLHLGEYGDVGFSSHRECHSSYSDMDDEEEEEQERKRAALALASQGLRTAGHFLSHLSVSSSSSGSSSSSSSGSISSSSLCSSDNDSSYSSEDEESSTLMLQNCLSPHRGLLQPSEPSTSSRQHSFVAKALAVSNTKGSPDEHVSNSKSLKRKDCNGSISKSSREFVKKPRTLPDDMSCIPRPKMSAFLVGRQMWRWSGSPTQRRGLKGKAKKLFYKAIVRGKEAVKVGDCAVFLSAGRPNLPYIGKIENFWESWTSSMVVKVKWFYHPEETKQGKRQRDGTHALYQSCHEDENDVQTISHKCQVVSQEEYESLTRNPKPNSTSPDLYYLAGTYDPTTGQLVTAEGVSILC
uniref:BAH domain and coiled-coil containing 1a n=1 Tax=Hippocampus comes TaxID=109280 RepID=A0A3Q2Y5Q0_HIPCM